MPETVSGCANSASIHTPQIIDSCMDKDCVEQLRVYLTTGSQAALDNATGAKTRCAELLFANVEVEPLPYKSGFYAVDITFFYRIIGDAILGGVRPTTITGVAIFGKRVVLCGGTASAKCFRSGDPIPGPDDLLRCSNPVAIVEALDPMILSSRVREVCECKRCESDLTEIPGSVAALFGEQLVLSGEKKRLYVTIGQFSTVRLERDNQLTIAIQSYSAPQRECSDDAPCEEDPCDLFSRIAFPMEKFFPEGCRCTPNSNYQTCGCEETK